MTTADHCPAGRTATFHTFGCKLNFAETATIERLFAERGIAVAAEDSAPDFIVVNSCSVTAEADRKCRSMIRSFHRRFPQAAIMVTGCYAQLKPDELRKLPGVVAVAGTNDKLKLAEIAAGTMAVPALPPIVDAVGLREFMPSCERGDRTRYFLKVQDGCDYWCTYCTIPRARGRSRSPQIEFLEGEARRVAAEGGREIVLTGVNIGDYGRRDGLTFLDLCRRLDTVDGIERYRISSIEPNLLTDELIDFVAASRRFMPHFHIPLQSGSDRVLELMRRRYNTDFFARKVERVRAAVPDAFIGVDLIVGARGETEHEFERSRAFVESLDISHLHVFAYSERPGTRALDLPDAVDQHTKHERSAVMTALSAAKHRAFALRFAGTVRPVLVEGGRNGANDAGFTDNYLRVSLSEAAAENEIINVRLDTLADDGQTFHATQV